MQVSSPTPACPHRHTTAAQPCCCWRELASTCLSPSPTQFPICSDTLPNPSQGCIAPKNWMLHYVSTTVGGPNYVTAGFTCVDGQQNFVGSQFLYAFK